MDKVLLKIVRLPHYSGELPSYQTPLSSGFDVKACIDEPIELHSLDRSLVPTGLKIQIPEGYEIQARPRSGWAIREGLSLINTPGTIDADYRGEIKIPLVNLSRNTITIHPEDRIAQLVVCPIAMAEFETVTALESSDRGAGGFGSTGQ